MSQEGASLREAVTFNDTPAPAAEPAEVKPVLKPVETRSAPAGKKLPLGMILGAAVIIAAGVGSGYFLAQRGGGVAGIKSAAEVAQTGIKVGDVVGSADETVFKDNATGMLDRGGIDGEGSHQLVREGGESQTVYLTSSVVDLEQFVGHKVQVWGETFAAQKAGWLMDVGRVKVLE
jgi:hypothetical protein